MRKKNKAGSAITLISIIPQSCSNQKSMELAQKQTHRSTEQNKDLKNEPPFIWAIIQEKGDKNIQQGKTISPISGVEKMDIYMQKY